MEAIMSGGIEAFMLELTYAQTPQILSILMSGRQRDLKLRKVIFQDCVQVGCKPSLHEEAALTGHELANSRTPLQDLVWYCYSAMTLLRVCFL